MLTGKDLERAVPRQLQELRRWVGWAPDPENERPKCPVIMSSKNRRASTRVPETWGTFKTAKVFYDRYADGKTVGIGYVFQLEDELVYVDVDDCLDENGELRKWAVPYVEPFLSRSYIELSPSKHGLHVITKGKLPVECAGGKMNFEMHASGWAKGKGKVPEVAIFAHGKYTTITGEVWKGHRKVGDGAEAVAQVWERAGIRAIGTDVRAGPAPEGIEERKVDSKRVPAWVKKELKDCTAADAPDRSAARFKLYAEAAQTLDAEDTLAVVVQSDWYELSGAAAKGVEHTWSDICRAQGKTLTAKKEFETAAVEKAERNEQAAVSWKELGVSVVVEVTKSGPVYRAVYGARNMAVVLEKHPDFAGRIRLNTFKDRLELDGQPMKDHDIVEVAEQVRAFLQWTSEPNLDLAWKAAVVAGNKLAFNPVQDYLKSLAWDKTSRMDDWLVRAGCEHSKVTRLIGRKWLISLVARALTPGCKVDTVLVLEGPQGMRKSTLFRTLAGGAEYFTDAHVTFDKDSLMIMHGTWILELAELATFQKAELLRTKQFVSGQDITYRPPYGRTTKTSPRHFLLVGSTNDEEYLTDHTGNRRYWPVRVGNSPLDLEWLKHERDQLFAEAVAAFQAGESWWFDEEPEELERVREGRMQADPLDSRVAGFIEENRGQGFELATLLEAIGVSLERKDLAQRVTNILRGMKLAKRKRRVGGLAPRWFWYDPVYSDGEEPAPVVRITGRDSPPEGEEVG